MTKFLVRLVVNAIALWVAVQIVPGLAYEGGPVALIVVALIFGVVNALVRPLLLLLTCPLVVLTLGLFILVVNTAMLWLTIQLSGSLGLSFSSTDGFLSIFFGSIIISVVSAILNIFIREDSD